MAVSTLKAPTETVSTTIGSVQSMNVVARMQGNILFLSGYIVTSTNQTFTADTTVCFSVDKKPSANRFFTVQAYAGGNPYVYVVKLNANGEVVFNNTVTVGTTYLFFNASLPIS